MQPHGYHRNPLSQCINNMRQLEGAKAAWAFENKKPDGTTVEWSDFIGPDLYIKSRPECPSGGNYVLGRIGQNIRCSHAEQGHTLSTSY